MTVTDLTPAQQQAVEHYLGPLLVLAGPGSGKTRVITRRIARLIDRGVRANEILAITFTNKAAREMEQRVRALVPGSKVWVSTFHRLCARLLRQYGRAMGLEANFSILDTSDQKELLKQALGDLNVDATRQPVSSYLNRISSAKNTLQTPEMFREWAEGHGGIADRTIASVYTAYQKALLQSNAVDFDDLLLHVCRLLAEHPEIRRHLDDQFRFVLVDEYQDTNLAQYQIIRGISQDHPNLCATGDPDQSIYGWRGAEIGNILRFESDFPSTVVVRLEQNYRSTKSILESAGKLIKYNRKRKPKELFTDNPQGAPVGLLSFTDEKDEAEGIARWIHHLKQRDLRDWSEFAIFFRTNALSRALEMALGRERIPYQLAQGVAFYERKEIKDVLAYLRLLSNANDRTAFRRVVNVPARGIGKSTVEVLEVWAMHHNVGPLAACLKAHEMDGLTSRSATAVAKFGEMMAKLASTPGGIEAILTEVLRETGYLSSLREAGTEEDLNRIENVQELLTAAQQYDAAHPEDGTLAAFLENSSLVSDVDALDDDSGKVTLMTLHASKGLEFPVVFVVAVEHNILPHERSLRDGSTDSLEEERRLLFVGMTRAEQRLFLTQTLKREFRGQRFYTITSEFLDQTVYEPTSLNDELRAEARRDDTEMSGDYGQGSAGGKRRAGGKRAAATTTGAEAAFVGERKSLRKKRPAPHAQSSSSLSASEMDASADAEAAAAPTASSRDASNIRSVPPHLKLMTGADLLRSQEAKGSPSTSTRAAPTEATPSDSTPAYAVHRTLRETTPAETARDDAERGDATGPFAVGGQVRHPRLGLGRVVSAWGSGSRRTVVVEFANADRRTFLADKAPLQPVGF